MTTDSVHIAEYNMGIDSDTLDIPGTCVTIPATEFACTSFLAE